MIIRIYSMFDRPARSYGSTMVFVNDEVARRAVLGIVRGDNGEIQRFPGDFDLFCLGQMDTDTGEIVPQSPVLVFNVAELLQAQMEA